MSNLMFLKHGLSAPLSVELLNQHRVRCLDVRKGDTVTIKRGNFRGVEGKVSKVDQARGWVYIEGVTKEKADGATVQVPIHASKITLRQLALDDKRRKEILERRVSVHPEPSIEEKPKKGRGQRRAMTSRSRGAKERKEA